MRTNEFDLVILDLGLPGIDGLMTLRHLRSFTDVPVVVLTVRDALSDKVAALESGADDYMVKPFEPSELLARSRAHLRRAGSPARRADVVRAGDLVIDLSRRQVTWAGEPVSLTPTELRLLEVLLANRGKLVTREQLVEQVFRSDTRDRPRAAPRIRAASSPQAPRRRRTPSLHLHRARSGVPVDRRGRGGRARGPLTVSVQGE